MSRSTSIEILTAEEVSRLVRVCSSRSHTGIRNAALVGVMYRAGLRVGEALALRVKDYDTADRVLRVLHGKGDKARTVALDESPAALLSRWLDRRHGLGLNGHHVLFCTLKGGVLAQSYVRQLLPRLAGHAGLEKRVHAHGLRHSFAAGLMSDLKRSRHSP